MIGFRLACLPDFCTLIFYPASFQCGNVFLRICNGRFAEVAFYFSMVESAVGDFSAAACLVCSDDYAEGILYAVFLSMIFNALRYVAGILEFVDDCCSLLQ